ncbi:hypothetical protein DV515_00019341, partial [Chloebia gouldiae]
MKRMFSCSSSQVTMESWTRQDQKLLEAVTRGDVARVAALAARKAARPAKLNARGQSALHLAAAGGLTECLTLLLEHGAPVNETNDDGGWGHPGTAWGHLGDALCHLWRSADLLPKAGTPGSSPGSVPREGGVPWGCPLGGQLSPGGVPSAGPVPTGSTALHLATIACQPQCVKVLLQHGANECHVDGQNRTPLHWAASSGCASSVLLLCDHEAPLDVPDTHGQTPLMLAAQGNHVAVCAQLLRRGAEPALADRDGRTALELALAHSSLEAAELLQGHQRDKDTRNVTRKAPSWALQKVLHCGRR